MIYTWKLNFVLLLSHFLVIISTTNVGKVVSVLFCQRHVTQLSFSTKYQRRNNNGSSTSNQRNSFKAVLALFRQR